MRNIFAATGGKYSGPLAASCTCWGKGSLFKLFQLHERGARLGLPFFNKKIILSSRLEKRPTFTISVARIPQSLALIDERFICILIYQYADTLVNQYVSELIYTLIIHTPVIQ
jgi:hypothetical protein